MTGKQKRYLRSLGVNLRPLILVGKEGLSSNLLDALDNALLAHELVKVSVLKSCEEEIEEVASYLSINSKSDLVQTIGRTLLFYRKNKEKKDGIRLP